MKTEFTKLEHAHAGHGNNGNFEIDEYFVRRPCDDVAVAADIIDPETQEPSEKWARLFAAAPDLLAAALAEQKAAEHEAGCDDCNDGEYPQPCYAMTQLSLKASQARRAAIAKATGGQS